MAVVTFHYTLHLDNEIFIDEEAINKKKGFYRFNTVTLPDDWINHIKRFIYAEYKFKNQNLEVLIYNAHKLDLVCDDEHCDYYDIIFTEEDDAQY